MGLAKDFSKKRSFVSEFYKRQIQLWGEKTQENLANKSIAIIGCGGLGCSIAYALGSSGIGRIYLVDFDKISLSNIHRQIAFEFRDEGRYKCEVLAKRLQKRALKSIKFIPHVGNFEEFAKNSPHVDLILDATDNLHVRKNISKFTKNLNLSWLYASVEEFYGQVCLFDGAKFEDIFKTANTQPKAQFAPMVMQVASFSANLALRYLADLQVEKDILYCLYLDKKGEFCLKNFNIKP